MSSVFSGCDFAAGWASGILGLIVGHPLDTIKVLTQTTPGKTNSLVIVSTLFKNEGIRGFYKGLLFPLISAGALNSLFFGVYGNSLRMIQEIRQVEQKMCWFKEIPYKEWYWDVFYAGCIGGFVCSAVNCPVELIKTQMQTQTDLKELNIADQRHVKFQNPWQCLKYQFKMGGIRGVYRGYVPLLWRDVPANGSYVLTYEAFICFCGQNRSKTHHSAIVNQFIGGALSGIVSWSISVPIDVIKSRIQADSRSKPQYKGMMDCAIKSYHQEGLEVFFRGFWLVVVRSIPVNAATFIAYEFFISLCT